MVVVRLRAIGVRTLEKTESGSNPFRYGTYRISGLMFEAEVVRDGQNDVIRS